MWPFKKRQTEPEIAEESVDVANSKITSTQAWEIVEPIISKQGEYYLRSIEAVGGVDKIGFAKQWCFVFDIPKYRAKCDILIKCENQRAIIIKKEYPYPPIGGPLHNARSKNKNILSEEVLDKAYSQMRESALDIDFYSLMDSHEVMMEVIRRERSQCIQRNKQGFKMENKDRDFLQEKKNIECTFIKDYDLDVYYLFETQHESKESLWIVGGRVYERDKDYSI